MNSRIFNNITLIRTFFEVRRFAGHSKWANIKHTKAIKDNERANTFTKLTRLIRLAVVQGGSPNPDQNLALAHAIEQCRRNNMPVATIQAALKAAETSKQNGKEEKIELKGPGGSAVLIFILTDNFKKTRIEFASIFRKRNFVVIQGSSSMFDSRGIIKATHSSGNTLETAVEHGIIVGAEDVTQEEDDKNAYFQFVCDSQQLGLVSKELAKLGYSILSFENEYFPKHTVQLNEVDTKNIELLYNKLEEHEDIIKIYDNVE